MTARSEAAPARPRATVALRRPGVGPPLLLLHATLSSSRQLRPLADRLAARFSVLGIDRRGRGAGARSGGQAATPLDVSVYVDDLVDILAAERIGPCVLVGHSYGGCLGLELAARQPALVRALWAYEPPYAPLAPADVREEMADLSRRTREASWGAGSAAAAEVFLAGVSGQAAVDALSPEARDRLAESAAGAVAEAALLGLDASGLSGIGCPVVIATGDQSRPFYAAIAAALGERIQGAVVERLAGLDHMAPLRQPERIARAVEAFAAP